MKKPTVLCLGPRFSYSHIAAMQKFPEGEFVFLSPHTEVLKRFLAGEGDYALVPIHNTNEGPVLPILKGVAKALLDGQVLHLIDRVDLPIKHCFAKKQGSNPSEIRSHVQALGQCSEWIYSSGLQTFGVGSTSLAAQMSAESDGSIAAICSETAAKHYDLEIVSSEIVNLDNENTTTFHVLSRKPNGLDKGEYRTELFFFPENKPGTLHTATGPAALAGVNLCEILSFYLSNELVFHVVLEGKPDEEVVDWVISGMRRFSKKLLIIGSYKL
ncbi:MAG: prephenate dehydratase domain-containing protein [bacterium]